MKIGNKLFDTQHHTYVMGILNVTPDSFSDGGCFDSIDRALFHTEQMVKHGASIIDAGGESTRPGYVPVTTEEEISRVCPVIEAIKERFDVPVSLDTYKSAVAEAGISSGADMINDIWGLQYDSRMAGLIADAGVSVCLMHNRKTPDYTDFHAEWLAGVRHMIDTAKNAGISDEKIILDPGIGFGKTYEHNLMALHDLPELKRFGYPVLAAVSRKSVIGMTLSVPVSERMPGTIAVSVYAVMNGISFVRVHDVKENVEAIRMTEAILFAC